MNLDNDIWLADAVRSVAILRPRDLDSTMAILRTLGLHPTTVDGGGSPEAAAWDTVQPRGEVDLEAEADELSAPEAGTDQHPEPQAGAGELSAPEAGTDQHPEPQAGAGELAAPEAGTDQHPEPQAGAASWRPRRRVPTSTRSRRGAGELATDEPLETLEPIAVETGGGMEGWRSAKPLEPVTTRHLQGVHDHEPLLPPGRASSILAVAVETQDLNGPVDIDRLVETVARARPVQQLPRLPLSSLVRGVQLLVDTGLGMEPFARDQQELASELRRVVGRSRVTELRFRNTPTRGAGSGPVWTWASYLPAAPGTPVLVLTDLGIGGPRVFPQRSQAWEWRMLAEFLARRGSSLIAFVPYPSSRFPPGLARSMTIVPWDRTTTISTVRSLESTRYGSGS